MGFSVKIPTPLFISLQMFIVLGAPTFPQLISSILVDKIISNTYLCRFDEVLNPPQCVYQSGHLTFS